MSHIKDSIVYLTYDFFKVRYVYIYNIYVRVHIRDNWLFRLQIFFHLEDNNQEKRINTYVPFDFNVKKKNNDNLFYLYDYSN